MTKFSFTNFAKIIYYLQKIKNERIPVNTK